MKIYLDPISTTSRPILMFLAENDVKAEIVTVSLFQNEHKAPAYAKINPNLAVPALDDDGFVLTEGSAILKYLADKASSPAYPRDLKARARVNQMMDWFNTGFYRDHGYGLVYGQTLPDYAYANATTQADTSKRARERADKWLKVLNDVYLSGRPFLTGNEVTIADYMAASYVSIGDWIGFDLAPYPNVARWLKAMRGRPSWTSTHAAWNALVAQMRGGKA
jgi:glutathione S-transferase